MKMSEFIRVNRKAKGYTQEQFGQLFNPSVNRAAVSKWEKGHVTNIKRSQIQRMCEIFGCAPSELMCFDSEQDTQTPSDELESYDGIKKIFGKQAAELVNIFNSFNEEGKEKLLDYAEDLQNSGRYKKDNQSAVVFKEA